MNEKQVAISAQLDQLRAEATRLKSEEKRARLQLAEVHRQQQAAMQAYRTIALLLTEVERNIRQLLVKDNRQYVRAQKASKQ